MFIYNDSLDHQFITPPHRNFNTYFSFDLIYQRSYILVIYHIINNINL